MSQTLTPINGGQGEVLTSVNVNRRNVLSEQAIELLKLQPRPTEWRPEGRPIYRRLPAVSEAYQIDFFEEKSQGWVYIPRGLGIFGPNSMQVVASENNDFVIIKGGRIVWEYGEIPVEPVVINCSLVGLQSTRYLIGYQLFYDDAPFDAQYSVSDFNLEGYDLEIASSTDEIVGWRYPAVNAFLSNSNFWKSRDNYYPDYAQPTEVYLSWKSNKYAAYQNVVLRCPEGTSYSKTATLHAKVDGSWVILQTSEPLSDSTGQYYKFELDSPTFQEEWKVSWEPGEMSISQVSVSGVLTLTSRPATATTRVSLVAYPENTVPKFFVNSQGEKIPLVLCTLAYVDVDELYQVTKIDDVRDIVYRDYKPVAEWLTRSQDEDLIDMFKEVSQYSQLWMNPQRALIHEYAELTSSNIVLSDSLILGQ